MGKVKFPRIEITGPKAYDSMMSCQEGATTTIILKKGQYHLFPYPFDEECERGKKGIIKILGMGMQIFAVATWRRPYRIELFQRLMRRDLDGIPQWIMKHLFWVEICAFDEYENINRIRMEGAYNRHTGNGLMIVREVHSRPRRWIPLYRRIEWDESLGTWNDFLKTIHGSGKIMYFAGSKDKYTAHATDFLSDSEVTWRQNPDKPDSERHEVSFIAQPRKQGGIVLVKKGTTEGWTIRELFLDEHLNKNL